MLVFVSSIDISELIISERTDWGFGDKPDLQKRRLTHVHLHMFEASHWPVVLNIQSLLVNGWKTISYLGLLEVTVIVERQPHELSRDRFIDTWRSLSDPVMMQQRWFFYFNKECIFHPLYGPLWTWCDSWHHDIGLLIMSLAGYCNLSHENDTFHCYKVKHKPFTEREGDDK